MIDWAKTEELYHIKSVDGYRPKVAVVCDKCGKSSTLTVRVKSKVINNQLPWECPKCVCGRAEVKSKLSKATKDNWQDASYQEAVRNGSVASWADPNYRHNHDKAVKSEISRRKCSVGTSEAMKRRWENPQYRAKITEILNNRINNSEWRNNFRRLMGEVCGTIEFSDKIKAAWQRDDYRAKMAVVRASMPRVSSIQTTLYSILDDLSIKYYREYQDKGADPETIIGPYNFDCVIPRFGKPTLLIECQGEYWHANDANDKRKASYVANNLAHQYELKCIWEHEFLNHNRVVELVKYWLGITRIETEKFDLNDIDIRHAEAVDYKLLLAKYHYLSSAGRGGIVYGAFLGDELIAVCVFSSLIRQNLPYQRNSTRELSRLCINPKYQIKNFGSWFISRCIKLLPSKYKTIISYCDTTFNHDGALYKASNFTLDGETHSDYWYVSADGWAMHKKTLYSHAIKMHMKEADYANAMGYVKIYGNKKLRFIYQR